MVFAFRPDSRAILMKETPISGAAFFTVLSAEVVDVEDCASDNTSVNGRTKAVRLSDRRKLRRVKNNPFTHKHVLCESESLFYSIAFELCKLRAGKCLFFFVNFVED